MKNKNDILGHARYANFVKKELQRLVAIFDKSQDKKDLEEISTYVWTLQQSLAKRQPQYKKNEIVVLFEEKISDLTILVNSAKSKHNAIGFEVYPHGERAIKF